MIFQLYGAFWALDIVSPKRKQNQEIRIAIAFAKPRAEWYLTIALRTDKIMDVVKVSAL